MKTQVRARLIDALLEGVVLPPLRNEASEVEMEGITRHNIVVRSVLGNTKCIEASNVARYFLDTYVKPQKTAGDFMSDLKALVPPYRSFFVEWEAPLIPGALRMGMLFLACTSDEALPTACSLIGEGAMRTPQKIAEFRKNPLCHRIYITLDFVEFPHSPDHISSLRGPYHVGVVSTTAEGDLIEFWASHASAIPEDESMQVACASMVGWTTLTMMNCQNIETVPAAPIPAEFQKARVRRGKKPLVSYHTIRVNLDKTPRSITRVALPGDGDDANRLHERRGHLKDYRKGKGLFGKYKGLWYWGSQLAGSGEEGVIVSDYKVEANDSPRDPKGDIGVSAK